MTFGARRADRVAFHNPPTVHIMAIDGTWRRTCKMLDVSSTGARVLVAGPVEGLQLKEFFLLLSSTGLAYRRCEMIRITGDEMGIRFLEERKATRGKPAPEGMLA